MCVCDRNVYVCVMGVCVCDGVCVYMCVMGVCVSWECVYMCVQAINFALLGRIKSWFPRDRQKVCVCTACVCVFACDGTVRMHCLSLHFPFYICLVAFLAFVWLRFRYLSGYVSGICLIVPPPIPPCPHVQLGRLFPVVPGERFVWKCGRQCVTCCGVPA